MVKRIRYINIPCSIHRYAPWVIELSVAAAIGAPLSQEAPIGADFLDEVVTRIPHIDIPCSILRYAARDKELPVAAAIGAPLSTKKASLKVEKQIFCRPACSGRCRKMGFPGKSVRRKRHRQGFSWRGPGRVFLKPISLGITDSCVAVAEAHRYPAQAFMALLAHNTARDGGNKMGGNGHVLSDGKCPRIACILAVIIPMIEDISRIACGGKPHRVAGCEELR